MTRALILTLALLAGPAHAALRGGTGPTTPVPTNPTPPPDTPPVSWQPPFTLLR